MSYIIYGRKGCSYCTQAKELLDKHSIKYVAFEYDKSDVDYSLKKEKLSEMINQKNFTYPQIFKEDKHIGGYEELLTIINT